VQCSRQNRLGLTYGDNMTNNGNNVLKTLETIQGFAKAAINKYYRKTSESFKKDLAEDLVQTVVSVGLSNTAVPYLCTVTFNTAHKINHAAAQSYHNLTAALKRWVAERKLLALGNDKYSLSLKPEGQGYLSPTLSLYNLLDQMEAQPSKWFSKGQMLKALQKWILKTTSLEKGLEVAEDSLPEEFEVKLPLLNSKKRQGQHRGTDPSFEMYIALFCQLSYSTEEFDDVLTDQHKFLRELSTGSVSFSFNLMQALKLGEVKRTTMYNRFREATNKLQAQLTGFNQATQRVMMRDLVKKLKSWYLTVLKNTSVS